MSQKWHLTHEAISCWLLLTLRVARKRFPSTGPPLSSQQKLKKQEHQRLMLNLATRVFQEALGTPFAIRTTHRSVIFTVAASIILKLGGRHDLILRTALRMAGEPGEPYVPTFVRDAGNHMLVMLWLVTEFLHTIIFYAQTDGIRSRNNAQMPATINSTAHQVVRESTAGVEVNRQLSHTGQAENQSEHRRETPVPNDCSLSDMDIDVSFIPFFEQHSEYLFPPDFDLNHFLFTPEIPQTEHGCQSQAPLSYLPTQPDSSTNASHLSGRATADSRASISQPVQAVASEATMNGFLPVSTMGRFTDAISPDEIGSGIMQNAEDWCSQRNSLSETTSPSTTRNSVGGAQPAQREALLSAVNQLMQVALTMR